MALRGLSRFKPCFYGFNGWLSAKQPSVFFFLDEKEAKNQDGSMPARLSGFLNGRPVTARPA
jgi:hypothetical protein